MKLLRNFQVDIQGVLAFGNNPKIKQPLVRLISWNEDVFSAIQIDDRSQVFLWLLI